VGDRLANRVAEANGSWAFILGLVAMTSVWVLVNSPGIVSWPAFDPYPCVFFNLVLAALVGLQGPLILMSQNRESVKERAKAEMDFAVNLQTKSTSRRWGASSASSGWRPYSVWSSSSWPSCS